MANHLVISLHPYRLCHDLLMQQSSYQNKKSTGIPSDPDIGYTVRMLPEVVLVGKWN